MVIGNSKNLHVFNFAILLKSRKFDAGEIYMFYISHFCCDPFFTMTYKAFYYQ